MILNQRHCLTLLLRCQTPTQSWDFPASINNKGLTISADLAFSHDKFPFDDNRKVNAANKVSGIMGAVDAEDTSYIVISHNDGISVGDRVFRNYSVGSGLSSPTVHDMASAGDLWFFATDSGLTVFSAVPGPSGQNPSTTSAIGKEYICQQACLIMT